MEFTMTNKKINKKNKVNESGVGSLRGFADILNENSILHKLNPEEYGSGEEYMRVLDQIDVQQIAQVMDNRGSSNAMFPSGWEWNDWGMPYPAKLAQALVMTDAKESVTDLGNVYYGRRKLSKEAMDIFRQDALRDPQTKALMTEHGLLNMGDLVKAEPQFMKKLFLTFSPEELQAFITAEEGYSGGDMKSMLKQIGL